MPATSALIPILEKLADGHWPEPRELAVVHAAMLADRDRALALNLSPATVPAVLVRQAQVLPSCYSELIHHQPTWFDAQLSVQDLLLHLWQTWLPLALQLADAQTQLGRPLIQGVLGGQGTGKTTLGAILKLLLGHLGKASVSLSLDDLYKTFADRQQLQKQDPRLIWRGPPGTHDIDLGMAVLDQLRAGQLPVQIPRFDKSSHSGAGDRGASETVNAADLVVFEGWFVGARPIAETSSVWANLPNPIQTEADRAFAWDMNQRLKDYQPLWQRLDRLLILQPTDYRLSLVWRQQAEAQRRDRGQGGMSAAEIAQFVAYFWRALHPQLFIQPLTQHPDTDLVLEIQANHQPGRLYAPDRSRSL